MDHMRIPLLACLIVFVKSTTENQLIRLVIAYLLNSVSATVSSFTLLSRLITPDLRPPNSPDLNPVDYRICSVLQERIYQKSVKNWMLMN